MARISSVAKATQRQFGVAHNAEKPKESSQRTQHQATPAAGAAFRDTWSLSDVDARSVATGIMLLSHLTARSAVGGEMETSDAVVLARWRCPGVAVPGSFAGLALLRKATVPSFGLPLRAVATRGRRRSRLAEWEPPEPQEGE